MTRISLPLLGALAFFGACSSAFEDCAETRSCAGVEGATSGAGNEGGDASGMAASGGDARGGSNPSDGGTANAGEAGDRSAGEGAIGGGGLPAAGNGGAGGSGPAPCIADDDCDDGLFCNGIEQCDEGEGSCVPGTDPCAAEPDHCDAACEEGEFAEVCVYTPLDADGDGHGDEACTLSDSPGDDCNDSPEDGDTIYPGAPELCNGASPDVDEDCDGLTEANDEVQLAGTTELLVPADGTSRRDHVSIAAGSDDLFGVVWADWRDVDGSMIYYRSLATDGTAGNEELVETASNLVDQVYPDIAKRALEFGVTFSAYRTDTGGGGPSPYPGPSLRYAEISTDGVTVSDQADSGAVAATPQVSPAAVYYISSLGLRRCTSSLGCDTEDADATEFNVARLGDHVAYTKDGDVYVSQGGNATISPLYNGGDASYPVITTNGGSTTYTAFRTPSGMRVGACTVPDAIPADIGRVVSQSRNVVLYWNAARTALFVRVISDNCTTFNASALVVEEDGTSIESASMAIAADTKVAVVWSERDTTSNAWTIKRRMFDVALCE